MGASAARHAALLAGSDTVTVIGPDEAGLPGAWHDEARLTRIVANDDVWATLAQQSIERYPQIAAEGGVEFHRTQGVLYVHERAEQFRQQVAVAGRCGAVFEVPTPDLFPYLHLPEGAGLILEGGGAGTVNPRALVANQLSAAQGHGARWVRDHAVRIEQLDGVARVHTAGGEVVEADRVLVAVGGHVNAFELFPEPLPVVATGITALFFEVPDGSFAGDVLAEMPGILWYEAHHDHFLYTVPPTRYPDGRVWFKIGGYRESGPLHSAAEIDEWYRTDGGRLEADMLRVWVAEHVPVLAGRDAHAVGCVVTDVASGFPMIREVSPNVVVATGCAGGAAKSCDEIGRIAAVLTMQGRWDSSLDQSLFQG